MGETEENRSETRPLKVPVPFGARIIVLPIVPVDDITARAKAVGLHAVIAEQNKPRPTTGEVVALGSDPLVGENFTVGDIVVFSRFAGSPIVVEGRDFLSLDLHEVICKLPK